MKRIKEAIIHWLGGYTEFEYGCERDKARYDSRKFIFDVIKTYADSLYGEPAEVWCEKMYKFIEDNKLV